MTTQDELATTSTVPTAATEVPSGTAGTRRITHGPTTRPSAMPIGRVVGPWVMRRVPAVPLGTSVAAVGTVLVVASSSWVVIAAGLVLAGLGVATLYPVTLVNLMRTPGLSQSMGSSLGALASGVAITVMPAFLALLAGVVDLRLAYLVVLPLLGATALLYGRPARG